MTSDPAGNSRDAALCIIERLKEAGYPALIAGGAVRDELLGLTPEDFDVATSARPGDVKSLFARVIPVGEEFGVVLVMHEGIGVQVATFRSEAEYRDGRHPVRVRFSDSAEEDASRRDFTINGLFLDPATGEVLDFVEGRADLDRRVIRCIGDPHERFMEDRLRMLRAVRFSAALDFEIEERTYAAIVELSAGAESLTAERVRDEILRIITGPRPGYGLDLLRETGLLAVVLPEVAAMHGVDQGPEYHPEGDVFRHTCLVLDALEDPGPDLALAALLHDVGKPPTFKVRERIRFDGHAEVGARMSEEICRRLHISRATTDRVVELVGSHMRFMSVRKMREAKLRRFLTEPLIDEHLALHRADCLSSHRNLTNHEFCLERRAEFLAEPPPAPRLLSGKDLIAMGFLPGPRFAEILREVDDLRLEGRLREKEEALRFVREKYATEGGEDA